MGVNTYSNPRIHSIPCLLLIGIASVVLLKSLNSNKSMSYGLTLVPISIKSTSNQNKPLLETNLLPQQSTLIAT